MTRTAGKRLLIVIAIFTLLAFASQSPVGASEGKVAICHLPPGNVENVQHIEVGDPAYDAHLAHGDEACVIVSDPSDEPEPTKPPAPDSGVEVMPGPDDGPPSCDSSPEVHAECAALAAGPGDECTEDMDCWDCTTMGNLICGPVLLPDTATSGATDNRIALGLVALALAGLLFAERSLRQR